MSYSMLLPDAHAWFAPFLIVFWMTSCTSGDNVNRSDSYLPGEEPGLIFSFREHLGLDCHMVSDCGFLVVIDSLHHLSYYKDSGQMILNREVQLSDTDLEELTDILDRGKFLDLQASVPHADSKRGRRTLTIASGIGVREAHTVVVFPEETDFAFPDGFIAFEQELRAFLLGKSGIEGRMFLDRTPRKL